MLPPFQGNSIRVHRYSKWRHTVDEQAIPELKSFVERGVIPSIRTLYYILESKKIIPHSDNSYEKLGKYLVEARLEGKIPWEWISDEGRVVIGDFDTYYVSPENYIESAIDYLQKAPKHYRTNIYRWHKQPHYVEVWIEKLALADTFQSYLQNRQVKIAVNKGYSSWAFIHRNCKRLSQVIAKNMNSGDDKQIHILYFGDFNPSGIHMERFLVDQGIEHFCSKGYFGVDVTVGFERIAVTQKQIKKYNLPKKLKEEDPALENDSRSNKFEQIYGELYSVDLDVLLAYKPVEFKQLVQKSVDKYFDKRIYQEEVLDNPEHSPEAICGLVCDKVDSFEEDDNAAPG
jgi:hypothetical protein